MDSCSCCGAVQSAIIGCAACRVRLCCNCVVYDPLIADDEYCIECLLYLAAKKLVALERKARELAERLDERKACRLKIDETAGVTDTPPVRRAQSGGKQNI